MFYGVNRTLCSVLDEMRKCNQTHNYSYLPSLIEEVQVLGNRMEAALYDLKDLESLHQDIKEKKTELKRLKELVNKEKLEKSDGGN